MAKRGPKPGTGKGGRKPGARNKVTRTIRELAEPHGEEALRILVKIMRRDKSSVARIAACREVLDRAFGKAAQPLTPAAGANGVLIEIVRFGPTLDLEPQKALPSPGDDP